MLILIIRVLWQTARGAADDVSHLSAEDVVVRPVLQMWQYLHIILQEQTSGPMKEA